MARVRVIHDPVGETLTVYWAEGRENQVCEETGEGLLLIKDAASGEVIGFERLSDHAPADDQSVIVELAVPRT